MCAKSSPIKKIKVSDLKIGMFLHKLDSTWLSTPFMFAGFKITSQKEIKKIIDYDIKNVFIDTSKGLDVGESSQLPSEDLSRTAMQTFEISVKSFQVGQSVPVDFFRKDANGGLRQVFKQGLTFTEEAHELLTSGGVYTVLVPLSQKRLYDKYIAEVEVAREKQKNLGFSDPFLDPKKVEAEYFFMNNYHAINLGVLVAGTKPEFDLFFREERKSPVHMLEKGAIIDGDKLDLWRHEDRNTLILKTDREAYRAYMMAHAQNAKDPRTRANFVRENSRIIIENLAENPRSETLMRETKESVTSLTDTVINNPTTFYGLMKINNYDYYTFTHSVNVATLSLALAISAGIDKKGDLADLGLGSILHDLGKSKVESGLINKPGKLTDEEFKKVSNHVMLGYEMLRYNKTIPDRAFYPLLQHHEKLSGNGYPNKLQANQIHQFGRISAIIDIYDALTTERSYKKAWKPFDALALISKNEGDFDKALFAVFVRLIHKQEA